MYYLYLKNYPGIVGKYGRNLGININKYDRNNKNENYLNTLSTNAISYQSKNVNDGRCHILLTSFLFVPKSLCLSFLTEKVKIDNFVKRYSKPLWNGEDIFLSLLSIIKYHKLPFVANNNYLFPIQQLVTNRDQQVVISSKIGHLSYRSKLVREIFSVYNNNFFQY